MKSWHCNSQCIIGYIRKMFLEIIYLYICDFNENEHRLSISCCGVNGNNANWDWDAWASSCLLSHHFSVIRIWGSAIVAELAEDLSDNNRWEMKSHDTKTVCCCSNSQILDGNIAAATRQHPWRRSNCGRVCLKDIHIVCSTCHCIDPTQPLRNGYDAKLSDDTTDSLRNSDLHLNLWRGRRMMLLYSRGR